MAIGVLALVGLSPERLAALTAASYAVCEGKKCHAALRRTGTGGAHCGMLRKGISMTTELLKDSRDNILGSIETGADGGQVLRDANGKIRGYYDPTTEHTRGPDQRILAKGNALRTLIC
jgi:hypothetical protein